MTKTIIEPKVGEEYLLYDGQSERKQTSFEGIYLGMNPVKNRNPFVSAEGPEGHIFARLNEEGEAEVYCTYSDERKLTLMWYSDGEDGPEWPAGFSVSRVDRDKISQRELEYLVQRLNKKNGERRVA
ncbi:hypothetical protein J4422_01205 [Candidatus Pacearchaeota archaeon]|nr:hypothetical protein [uncultured archaeon]MBS3086299.1 hypothetical protein [Candidatus Pacearchaeota archaeon]